jgi:hypothetical protein
MLLMNHQDATVWMPLTRIKTPKPTIMTIIIQSKTKALVE